MRFGTSFGNLNVFFYRLKLGIFSTRPQIVVFFSEVEALLTGHFGIKILLLSAVKFDSKRLHPLALRLLVKKAG